LVDSLEADFAITIMKASAAQEVSPQIGIVGGGFDDLSAV
jgi:hypothetical protein